MGPAGGAGALPVADRLEFGEQFFVGYEWYGSCFFLCRAIGEIWYSEQVLAKVLTRTHRYKLGLMPLYGNLNRITEDNVIGAIVNQRNLHWVALRSVESNIWLLDSLSQPRVLNYEAYVRFVIQWPNSFPVERL